MPIDLMLNKDKFLPGEVVEGLVRLTLAAEKKARSLKVSFLGEAKTEITQFNPALKIPQTHTESETIVNAKCTFQRELALYKSLGERVFVIPPGTHQYRFAFRIPGDAPPLYKGENANVHYTLEVKLDVPWRADVFRDTSVEVLPKYSTKPRHSKVTLQKQTGIRWLPASVSPKVNANVEISGNSFSVGETIEGRVRLNTPGKGIGEISTELYAIEHAEAEGHEEDTTLMSQKIVFPGNSNAEQGFRIETPKDIMPTFQTKYFRVYWYLKIRAKVTEGGTIKAEVPLVIK